MEENIVYCIENADLRVQPLVGVIVWLVFVTDRNETNCNTLQNERKRPFQNDHCVGRALL